MKKNVLLLIGLIIIIILGGYIVYDKVLTDEKTNNYNNINNSNNNSSEQEDNAINPNDYVELVDKDFSNDNINIQVVEFKNLSAPNYMKKQNQLIEKIQNSASSSVEPYTASSDIWYQVNDNILTVYYELDEKTEIGDCNTIITTNIDLSTKKELTNEDVLKLGNYSFESFALEEYNNALSSYDSGMKVYDSNNKEISKEEFINNKDSYLEKIESGLEDVIVTYIKDNQINYSYIQTNVDILYQYVAKGGCFPYTTRSLGNLR